MMKRELIIDAASGYVRAGVIEDGRLCEIHGEKQSGTDETGSIFLARVQSVKPAIHAAFLDIGTKQNAFLPLRDEMSLRCGSMMIVQGTAKQTNDSKGLRISDKINLAGRWVVLIPGEHGVHISKKVKSPEMRSLLMETGLRICPAGFGLIIRTASEEITEDRLCEEVSALVGTWNEICQKAAGMTSPGLLFGQLPLHMRLVRDLRHVDRIVVNDQEIYGSLLNERSESRIPMDAEIECFDESKQLLFDAFNLEVQIDKALKNRVWLPGGGYLVMDFCEAMTVIDVNSGKMILGKDLEQTALQVNLEAADEIARQIRLRDIGGIIIADFIDMKQESHKQALIDRMKAAASSDRSQITVAGLTRFGLMEMSRKRAHTPLRKAICCGCSYCSGNAFVLSGEEVARRILRQIRRMHLSGQRGPFVVRCNPAAGQALLCHTASRDMAVYVISTTGRHAEKYDIEQIGDGASLPKDAAALRYED